MKTVFLILLFLPVLLCQAETAQACFSRNVHGVESIEIIGTGNWRNIKGPVALYIEEKEIDAFLSLIKLVDPIQEFDENGEKIFTLPSFCCADFVINVTLKDCSEFTIYLKHEIRDILFPSVFEYWYPGEIKLTRSSSQRLRRYLSNTAKRANKSAQAIP